MLRIGGAAVSLPCIVFLRLYGLDPSLVLLILIEKNVDPNIQDNNGKTPLDLAEEKWTQDQENGDLKEIVNILNQQIQSPSASEPGSQLPETTGGTNDNPETCLSTD